MTVFCPEVKVMEINLGGESNFTGFEIYDENGRKIKTSRYKETETAYRPVMKRNVCLILGGGFLALYLCTISGILILSYILLSTVGFYFLLDGAYREYKRLQWEAAKKKLIWILVNEIPLSFHNLKEAPIEESDCGNIKRKIKEPNNRQLEKALQVGKRYIEYHNSSSLFSFSSL